MTPSDGKDKSPRSKGPRSTDEAAKKLQERLKELEEKGSISEAERRWRRDRREEKNPFQGDNDPDTHGSA
jgi:hypothetical protein